MFFFNQDENNFYLILRSIVKWDKLKRNDIGRRFKGFI